MSHGKDLTPYPLSAILVLVNNNTDPTDIETEDEERILDLAEQDYPGIDRELLRELQEDLDIFG
jgi:hypothetical protein